MARASAMLLAPAGLRNAAGLLVRLVVAGVAAEQARRRELAELVTHHVLGHIDRDELVAVVHGEGVAHELGQDRACPAPGLHHPLLVAGRHGGHLAGEVLRDVRPLLDATSHDSLDVGLWGPSGPGLRRLAAATAAHDQALRGLLGVARLHAFLLAPRADDVASAARAATVRVIHGVHHLTTNLRA